MLVSFEKLFVFLALLVYSAPDLEIRKISSLAWNSSEELSPMYWSVLVSQARSLGRTLRPNEKRFRENTWLWYNLPKTWGWTRSRNSQKPHERRRVEWELTCQRYSCFHCNKPWQFPLTSYFKCSTLCQRSKSLTDFSKGNFAKIVSTPNSKHICRKSQKTD